MGSKPGTEKKCGLQQVPRVLRRRCKPGCTPIEPPKPELVVMMADGVEPVSNKSGAEGGLDIKNEDATGLAAPDLPGIAQGMRLTSWFVDHRDSNIPQRRSNLQRVGIFLYPRKNRDHEALWRNKVRKLTRRIAH